MQFQGAEIANPQYVMVRIQKDKQRTPLFHDLTLNNG